MQWRHPVRVDLYRFVAELVTRLGDPTFALHKLPVYAPPFSFEAPGECTRDRGTNLAACPRARHNLFHLIVVKPLEAEPYQLNRSRGNNSPPYIADRTHRRRGCVFFSLPSSSFSLKSLALRDYFLRLVSATSVAERTPDLLVDDDYSNSSLSAINLSADFCALMARGVSFYHRSRWRYYFAVLVRPINCGCNTYENIGNIRNYWKLFIPYWHWNALAYTALAFYWLLLRYLNAFIVQHLFSYIITLYLDIYVSIINSLLHIIKILKLNSAKAKFFTEYNGIEELKAYPFYPFAFFNSRKYLDFRLLTIRQLLPF